MCFYVSAARSGAYNVQFCLADTHVDHDLLPFILLTEQVPLTPTIAGFIFSDARLYSVERDDNEVHASNDRYRQWWVAEWQGVQSDVLGP